MRPLTSLLLHGSRAVGTGAPLALLLALSACDTSEGPLTSITFGGVTYDAIGGAVLEETASGLVVGSSTSNGEFGVRVALPGPLVGADFHVQPVDLPAGSRWWLQLFGEVGGVDGQGGTVLPVATAWSEALDDSTHAILFDYAPEVGATTVTIEYYLGGELLYSVPGVPLAGDGLRAATGGMSSGKPGSVHLVRDGSTYIVVTDYEGASPRTGAGGCAGALVQTGFEGLPLEFCTDLIQAIPNAFRLPSGPPERIEVRGRVPLEQFTLTSGDVDLIDLDR